MLKILFPTDFSKNSLSVLPWAADFCKAIKAELVLFNAMLAPVLQTDGPVVNAEEIIEEQADFIKDKLAKIAVNIRTKHNVIVNIRTEYGFPTETIASLAKNDNFDLIILSAKGDTNILDSIFGNVTENLFEKAEIPVLSVPTNLEFKNINKVAFASSNIDYDAVQIFDLLEMLKPCNTKIKLVHIVKGNDFENETFEDFPNLEYIELSGEDKLKTFSDYIHQENIDLICVKRYKLPFLYRWTHKSFSEDLLQHIKKPLLVFKDE